MCYGSVMFRFPSITVDVYKQFLFIIYGNNNNFKINNDLAMKLGKIIQNRNHYQPKISK